MLTLALRCFGPRKTPSGARRISAGVLLVLFALPRWGEAQVAAATATPVPSEAGPATAGAALTEADVIRLARSRSPAARVAGATDELAAARTRTAAPFTNPSVAWARETVLTGPTGARGSEDVVGVSVAIDVARQRATRSLVASEGAWMRAEAALARADGILDAVLAYYDVVLAERRVAVLADSVTNFEEAVRVLARREATGSASGYESTRLVIARELGQSHLAESRGALAAARARLGALLGARPDSLRVAAELELVAPGREDALARGRGIPREAVRRARESLRLAGEAEERAGLAWSPAVELGGGVKRANDFDGASGYGYVVGVAVSVPLFDRGQAQREQARAQRALAGARSDALVRSIDAEVESALATFRAARDELARFEAQTSGQVGALLGAAQSGYREGERSILELLDAQRAQTEVAERRLTLLGAAKRAEARLRAAAGELQ